MAAHSKIQEINRVIRLYFENNPLANQIPAKDLMLDFIKAGVFTEDRKRGLPIRKILRELDEANELSKIPNAYPDRKIKNTKWYFVSKPGQFFAIERNKSERKSSGSNNSKSQGDEHYVLDLLDEILGHVAIRQHTFDFVLGDSNKNGTKRKLPFDAYYPELNLVVEYMEIQHDKPVNIFDKKHILTTSGVDRGEQRKIYDDRKRRLISENGIQFISISHLLFNCSGQNRIKRNKTSDLEKLKDYLIIHIPEIFKL